MFSTRKYSIRKVSVGIASVLIGIAAGSLGTASAHEETNNVVVSTEVNHDVNSEHVNKPVLEEPEKIMSKPELAPKPVEPIAPPVCEDCKHEEKPHVGNVGEKPILEEVEKTKPAPEVTSKPEKQNVTTKPIAENQKEDSFIKSILEDKIDWNSIDEKEFINYLFADIKVDKKKEQEIKEVWLTKVNQLLSVAPNNINLQKVKAILENSLKGDSSVKVEKPKEEKVTEDKKDNKESVKETDKKDTPKEQTVPENKQEVPSKETPKVTSDKKDSSNDKKQETSENNNTPVKNKVLSATLSGRDVAVSFDKNKIKADDVFVGAINDEKLNKTIIEKLGSEYKVIEVFEIHFKKDGKKLDSDAERTVKVSVVKNDNAELEVYHIADNNVLEKVESSFNDGSLQFKINHFSKFTILERIRVGAKDLESRVQIVTPVKAEYKEEHKNENSNNNGTNSNKVEKETSKKEKEELPKTGLKSEQTISMALLALGAAIAIRRKQKQ
ncbi:YSIRK-type signal peptide-containing protein [Gemella sp. 20925_1_85]|uniref:YSIRK-type signal peptide-containing protein n=1 Tax=Gemella sp. 20925_1_85 TaxID=3003690 RepID=UPI00352BE070